MDKIESSQLSLMYDGQPQQVKTDEEPPECWITRNIAFIAYVPEIHIATPAQKRRSRGDGSRSYPSQFCPW